MAISDNIFYAVMAESIAEFSKLTSETIQAMSPTMNHIEIVESQVTKSNYQGICVIAHFFGEVQGFFLISTSNEKLQKLLGIEGELSLESKSDSLEFINEVLNISVAQSLPTLESFLGQLSYSPPTICVGDVYLPPYMGCHYHLVNLEEVLLECSLFINRAEVKIGLELEKAKSDLEMKSKEAYTDSLTNLKNRNFLNKSLPAMVQSFQDLGQELSLYWIDLDFFKEINDTYGHQIGDLALSVLGKVILSISGEDDIAFRYGGDEFLVMLPEQNIHQALKVAQKFKSQLEQIPIETGIENPSKIFLSVSMGVVSLKITDTHKSFLTRADACLYKAKEEGRGRIVIENENVMLTISKGS